MLLEDTPIIQSEPEEENIDTGIRNPQPSTSGNIQQASVRNPPPASTTPAPPVQRRTRRTRYHSMFKFYIILRLFLLCILYFY